MESLTLRIRGKDFFIMGKETYQQIKMVGLLFMVPVVVGVWPIAGFFLGDFLSKSLGWPGFMALIFAGLGLMAGILELLMIFKALPKEQTKEDGKVS